MKVGFYIECVTKGRNHWVFLDEETKEILNVVKWVLPLLNHEYSCEQIQTMLPDMKDMVPTAINYIKDVFVKTCIPDYARGKIIRAWSWPRITEVKPTVTEDEVNEENRIDTLVSA